MCVYCHIHIKESVATQEKKCNKVLIIENNLNSKGFS